MTAQSDRLFDLPGERHHVPEHAGMGGHQRANQGATNTWLTPPWIVELLGPFDLDPCTPEEGMPWPTATRMLTPTDNGLTTPWRPDEFVWCNPIAVKQ